MRSNLLEPDGINVRRGRDVPPDADVSVVILVMRETSRLERCLDSLRQHLDAVPRVEVIVLANGTPASALAVLQEREDIVLIRSLVNHGFGGGCNWAVRFARGDRIVFLNDDTEVTAGWLEGLNTAMDSAADAAVVGSRIVLEGGRLQEAGSVIWRDGTTRGIGRGEDPEASRHQVRRPVDYVSFCSAMVRRDAWTASGGFDERYFPAYYEDADLCLTFRQNGWRTIYAPRSVVRHAESVSTVLRFRHFISERNRRLFVLKWADVLVAHEPAPVDSESEKAGIVRALRRAGGARPSLLMIDDCEPDPGLGAGFGRMHDAVVQLHGQFDITFVASYLTVDRGLPWLARRRSRTALWLGDIGVHLSVGDPTEVIRDAGSYDAVLISRPTNYAAFASLVARFLPTSPVIYDTESLWHRRLFRQAELAEGDTAARLRADAIHYQRVEETAIRAATVVVCVTDEEAVVARSLRHDSRAVVVPANLVDAEPTLEQFAERFPYILFAASWLAGRDSPNLSALQWMVAEVMPLILRPVPWARLLVTGANPPPEVAALEGPSVTAVGFVSEIREMYSKVRVVVCPMLAGAGVKLKVVEALQNGVPTVSTSVGAEGIDTGGLQPLVVVDDATAFAQSCVMLLTDAGEWASARAEVMAYGRARSANDRSSEVSSWHGVVQMAIGAATGTAAVSPGAGARE